MSDKAAPYQATDSDLPAIFSEPPAAPPAAPQRSFADAQHEAARQVRGLGLTASNREMDLCALTLFCSWEDERMKVLNRDQK